MLYKAQTGPANVREDRIFTGHAHAFTILLYRTQSRLLQMCMMAFRSSFLLNSLPSNVSIRLVIGGIQKILTDSTMIKRYARLAKRAVPSCQSRQRNVQTRTRAAHDQLSENLASFTATLQNRQRCFERCLRLEE